MYHVFDHPEAWYYAIGNEYWDGPAATTVAYLTRLFADPVPPLEGYTDAELNRGFWYLISSGGSDMMVAVMDASVPLSDRVHCVKAMYTVFEQLFLPRCTPFLSHLDEPGVAPLNSACYMWWDLIPAAGQPGDALNDCFLAVMERELALDHVALHEGALHGLGHWSRYHAARIEAAIDAFLARHSDLRPELRNYALAARSGCVL